jgi:cytochrome c biogenesis protein ResB
MFNLLSLILLVSVIQCVLSIPSVKETMFSLTASDVNNKWNEFKLKHSRSFKNASEETRKYKSI